MLRVMFTVAISPLASVTVPLTTCPAPSDVMIDDAGQLVIAAVPAVHVKDTVTLLSFQPTEFWRREKRCRDRRGNDHYKGNGVAGNPRGVRNDHISCS